MLGVTWSREGGREGGRRATTGLVLIGQGTEGGGWRVRGGRGGGELFIVL